jgi:hypothetical protein
MALDRHSLEEAGRLLLGNEWKRPLARLLGPYHPDGPRETLDPRLPFRWAVDPSEDPKTGARGRPIPEWVGPVLSRLLAERADVLAADADRARALSDRLRGE